LPKAAREAVEILTKHFPSITEFALVPASGGVFEVTVGDELVFSKKDLERFPEEGELERLITARIASQ
jgi:selenoprotein W-related protein